MPLICLWLCSILILSLTALGQGAMAQDIPARLVDIPAFETMSANGFEAGDRGAEEPNRFDPYMALFVGLTQPSQQFILRAFVAGALTDVPEGKTPEVENGKLAVNLINLVVDMEILATFVDTREIPESGHLPRADDNLERLLRKYPNVAEVITLDIQARIVELEVEVDRVLDEESERIQQTLEESRARLAETRARLAETRAEVDRLRTENEALRFLEGRMQSILDVVSP